MESVNKNMSEKKEKIPKESKASKTARGGLQIAGSAPFVGGIFSAIAGAWSEHQQEKVNNFFKQWIGMLEDELKEKEQTVLEIMLRIDMQDEKIAKRVDSDEYKSLLKKTFREWAGVESEDKRVLIKNILANAASSEMTSDEVIRLFIDWLKKYSELHFKVIAIIYKNQSQGISRGNIWDELGKERFAENSSDADLFKLLISDLNIGRVIRQYREVDYDGNFIPKTPQRRPKGSGPKPPVSAFDDEELYVLTGLGQEFVHYAMTDLPIKLEYHPEHKEG